MTDQPIAVGGAYVENEDHVPNPTDMVAQYNTSGVGAHGRIEEVSPVFEVDKVKTSQEILAALDEDDTSVPSSRVHLPDDNEGNEVAAKRLTKAAETRVKQGVVIGGPTPAEREAEKSGDEGVLAAVDQEQSNAASNSTGNRNAGQHEGSVSTGDAGKDDTALAGARRGRNASSEGKSDDGESKSDADDEDQKGDKYDDMEYADLQSEVASRNEGRSEEDQIKPEDRKGDTLKAALRADDEKNA